MKRIAILLALWLGTILGGVHAATPDEVATKFFKGHPNEIDVEEQDGRILFANRQVGLEFRKTGVGFELVRMYGIEEEQDFLSAPKEGEPRNLFEIRMALDPKHVGKDDRGTTQAAGMSTLERMAEMGHAFVIGSQSGKSLTWRLEKGEKESTLHLEWKGMDAQSKDGTKDENVLDAEVMVTLRAGDPLSRWRIAVRNRSARYGIERVRLPILSLAPIGEARKNVFIYPKWRGGYIEDPFNAPVGFGEGYHKEGAFYPYYVNMQFWALYNQETNRGVYLGTQDPSPHMTHILLENTPADIAWSVGHFPPNMSFANEDFVLPYDCVVGPFRGDWYDACQIYRKWALKQSWCQKGPLSTRSDIPKWYKESPLIFYTNLSDSATGTHSFKDNLPIAADNFREWLKWAGLKLPANWYGGKDYRPDLTGYDVPFLGSRTQTAFTKGRWSGLLPVDNRHDGNYPKIPAMDGFSQECKRLKDEGGMVCPYVATQLYDQGPAENAPYAAEAKPNIIRDSYGAICTWPGEPPWAPCSWTPWWRERLKETCVTMLQRENIGGFYLDVMHGMSLPCFWTPHGHTAAGGDSMTKGMHELCGYVRDAVKAKDPEAIITGEDSAENMIDAIDGALYQRTLRPENKVPLFGTVYNDYIPRYGLDLSVGLGKDFYIECGSLFSEGAQVGRLRLKPRDYNISFQDPDHREMIDFLGGVVGYYKQDTAKKFLVYGQLRRPVVFSKPAPMPSLDYGSYDKGLTDIGASLKVIGNPQFPALMNGVFRSTDGELGVFVVNVSDAEIPFEADLDLAAYGIPPNARVTVDIIAPDSSIQKGSGSVQGAIQIKGSLPGHQITLFRIRITRS